MQINLTVNGTGYTAEYNAIRGVHGFTSSDALYSVYLENEATIERAANQAADNRGVMATVVSRSGNTTVTAII